jgi:hypothetical protein
MVMKHLLGLGHLEQEMYQNNCLPIQTSLTGINGVNVLKWNKMSSRRQSWNYSPWAKMKGWKCYTEMNWSKVLKGEEEAPAPKLRSWW